uniref:Uncharacterized protein n=1 Tax=Anguilla anguilla TaxID=7936 RepID=A0A0E9VQ56_ANGAN
MIARLLCHDRHAPFPRDHSKMYGPVCRQRNQIQRRILTPSPQSTGKKEFWDFLRG